MKTENNKINLYYAIHELRKMGYVINSRIENTYKYNYDQIEDQNIQEKIKNKLKIGDL